MSTQHTPGPWTAEEGIIVDADGCLVAQVLSTYIEGANYRDAHARLIAAAPAMYEALKELLECNELCADVDSLESRTITRIRAGQAALAQAEGRGDT